MSTELICLWKESDGICSKKYPTFDLCYQHLIADHLVKGEQTCKWFTNGKIAHKAVFLEHEITHFPQSFHPVKCDVCFDKFFRSKNDLRKHKRSGHGDVRIKRTANQNKVDILSQRIHNDDFQQSPNIDSSSSSSPVILEYSSPQSTPNHFSSQPTSKFIPSIFTTNTSNSLENSGCIRHLSPNSTINQLAHPSSSVDLNNNQQRQISENLSISLPFALNNQQELVTTTSIVSQPAVSAYFHISSSRPIIGSSNFQYNNVDNIIHTQTSPIQSFTGFDSIPYHLPIFFSVGVSAKHILRFIADYEKDYGTIPIHLHVGPLLITEREGENGLVGTQMRKSIENFTINNILTTTTNKRLNFTKYMKSRAELISSERISNTEYAFELAITKEVQFVYSLFQRQRSNLFNNNHQPDLFFNPLRYILMQIVQYLLKAISVQINEDSFSFINNFNEWYDCTKALILITVKRRVPFESDEDTDIQCRKDLWVILMYRFSMIINPLVGTLCWYDPVDAVLVQGLCCGGTVCKRGKVRFHSVLENEECLWNEDLVLAFRMWID